MGRSRNLALVVGAAAFVLAALILALVFRPEGAQAVAQSASGNVHVGVATCGGTTCHGPTHAGLKNLSQDEHNISQ